MNGLPDLRLLPDAPVPDGRTVLTDPHATSVEAVTGSQAASTALHTGYQPARALQPGDRPPHRRRRHLPQRRVADPARRRPADRAEPTSGSSPAATSPRKVSLWSCRTRTDTHTRRLKKEVPELQAA